MYFFVADLSGNSVAGRDAEHLWAMRPEQGEKIWVTNLAGDVVRAKIRFVQKKQRGVVWTRLRTEKRENTTKNILIQAKPDRAYLEKLVEILPHAGVEILYIVDADLSEKKQPVNLERLDRILIRACEQAEVAYLPRIEIVLGKEQVHDLIQKLRPTVLDIITTEKKPIIKKGSEKKLEKPVANIVLVGPEGGWSDAEKTWFDEQDLARHSLGAVVFPAWLAGFGYFQQVQSCASNCIDTHLL